jgi:hypothetical protein
VTVTTATVDTPCDGVTVNPLVPVAVAVGDTGCVLGTDEGVLAITVGVHVAVPPGVGFEPTQANMIPAVIRATPARIAQPFLFIRTSYRMVQASNVYRGSIR